MEKTKYIKKREDVYLAPESKYAAQSWEPYRRWNEINGGRAGEILQA